MRLGPLANEGASLRELAPLYGARLADLEQYAAGKQDIGTGRVFNGHAPDPTIDFVPGGQLVAAASNNFNYVTGKPFADRLLRMPMYTSDDGINFVPRGDGMASWPEWVKPSPDSFWAPNIVAPRHDGEPWRMYYTGLVKDSLVGNARPAADGGVTKGIRGLGVATSTDGLVYHPQPEPLVISKHRIDAIDPTMGRLPDGGEALYWGSGQHPINAQRLSEDGLRLIGEPTVVAHPHPTAHDGFLRLIEAPEIIANPNGRHSLLVSGDSTFYADRYNVTEMQGPGPFGPFEAVEGPRLIQNIPGVRAAPGHQQTISDAAGERWLYFHAFDHDVERGADLSTRKLHMAKLDWSQDESRWLARTPTHGPDLS